MTRSISAPDMYGLRISAENVRSPSDADHRAADRRLAGAGLAGEQQHALVPPQTAHQLLERALVRRAQEQELGVGRNRERLFFEAVKGLVNRIGQRLE